MSAHRFYLFGVLVLSLAACQSEQTESAPNAPTATAASRDSASTGVSHAPAAASTSGEHADTKRYKIDIEYPALSADEAALGSMLRRIAATAKQEFMQSLPDPKQFPEFADRQMQLLIDFKIVARTSDFVSVRETGMQDTGGAHPIPIDSTIVYDVRAHRTVTLDDLFDAADAARKVLADWARTELTNKIMAQAPKPGEGSPEAIREWKANAQKMIDGGTQPTEQNFANFIVRVDGYPSAPSPGLMLVFPPYQVAAYVYGTQTVNVPAEVFAKELKPQYRDAFARN